jgi:hypothetical protein
MLIKVYKDRGSEALVEPLTHKPKIERSNLATACSGREKNSENNNLAIFKKIPSAPLISLSTKIKNAKLQTILTR